MGLYGPLADAEFFSNLFIPHPLGGQLEHLYFTRIEVQVSLFTIFIGNKVADNIISSAAVDNSVSGICQTNSGYQFPDGGIFRQITGGAGAERDG